MEFKHLAVIAALDAILGVAIFFVCFCRIVATDKTVLKRVRLKFVLLGPAALAFGASPLWGDWPGLVNPILLTSILAGLIAETYQWRRGPPSGVFLDEPDSDFEYKESLHGN